MMNKQEAKLWALEHMKELVEANIDKLGPAMDDYDGGQLAAYDRVLKDIRLFKTIIDHSIAHPYQQDPGMDY